MTSLENTEVSIDLTGLKRFQRHISQPSTEVKRAIKQWGFRYRSFVQERFVKYSRGGGDWPPLSAFTMQQRRGTTAAILRDTSTLFAALNPTFQSLPGQLEKDISFGVRVGFGGPHKHPKGQATIADIAKFHHVGMGRNPKREIIVRPTQRVIRQMADDMKRALERIARAN